MLRNDIFYYVLRNESYHWEAPDQAALILKMEAVVTVCWFCRQEKYDIFVTDVARILCQGWNFLLSSEYLALLGLQLE